MMHSLCRFPNDNGVPVQTLILTYDNPIYVQQVWSVLKHVQMQSWWWQAGLPSLVAHAGQAMSLCGMWYIGAEHLEASGSYHGVMWGGMVGGESICSHLLQY